MNKLIFVLLLVSGCATVPQGNPTPTPSPSSSPTPVASPSESPSPTPSVQPSSSPAPSSSPSPSQSPTPTTTPSPITTPSQSPTPTPSSSPVSDTLRFTAMNGETLGFFLTAKTQDPVSSDVTVFSIGFVQTQVPSFQGAQVGLFADPLTPTTSYVVGAQYWVDVVASTSKVFQILGNNVSISVVPYTMPAQPTVPMYMELTSQTLLTAHNLPDNVSYQGPITQVYNALYRAHRIEPIKQNIVSYPPVANGALNLDNWSNFNASFRQLVLDGAIAPPCLFGPLPTIPPDTTMLGLIQSSIVAGSLPGNSWAYAWDEGENDVTATTNALARVQLIKQNAPMLNVMVTREETSDFDPYVDFYVPVMDWFKQPGHVQTYSKPYGLYTSCMANGNCSNQATAATVQPPSGTPMMVVDADPVNWRAFPVVGYMMGATRLLYYDGVKNLTTAFQPGGLYNEGGNGDGTLVYPCGAVGCSSLRLKFLRRGLQDIEWLVLAKNLGKTLPQTLVTDTLHWSHNQADYDGIPNLVTNGQ